MGRIVVDWGSSNFRAYRFAADGQVIDTHQAPAGILAVENNAFEAVLMREIGPWIDGAAEVFLSGMITSRNGWLETPYVETPASLAQLAEGAKTLALASGTTLRFLPGVMARSPMPDVMRGEEIQVFGSVTSTASATLILPGTHSKWVRVEHGRITGFRTFLTGELYALLKTNSIVGRLIPPGERPFDAAAFRTGVRQAFAAVSAGLLNDIFTTRSGALLGDFTADAMADRLSGILIGHELRSGLALGWDGGEPTLIADPALCERYQEAFAAIDRTAIRGPDHAAVEGFRKLSSLGV